MIKSLGLNIGSRVSTACVVWSSGPQGQSHPREVAAREEQLVLCGVAPGPPGTHQTGATQGCNG